MHSSDTNIESSKLKGRIAIEYLHKNILSEDEPRIDHKIAEIYGGIDSQESREIHVNYHAQRLFASLRFRTMKNGMTDELFRQRIKDIDLNHFAFMIATGQMREMAASDKLYNEICFPASERQSEDRYMNFYS